MAGSQNIKHLSQNHPSDAFPKECRSNDTEQLLMPNAELKYTPTFSHLYFRTLMFTDKSAQNMIKDFRNIFMRTYKSND